MAAALIGTPQNAGRSQEVMGRRRVHLAQITLDSSYPTGGEAVDFRNIGVQNDANARYFFQQRGPITGGYVFVYDRTNRKLLVFWVDTTVDGAALAQVADTTDLSAVIVDVFIVEE